jgi:predicted nuclease of predicted toxin-antitoxin system
VRLLFDENLSRSLVRLLDDVFPDSEHVSGVGLLSASDEQIWQFARHHGRVIVTKDSDFHERSVVLGGPPKVVWLRCGNRTTLEIAELLRANSSIVKSFFDDHEVMYLAIYG